MEVRKLSLPGVNTIINDRFYTLSRTEIPVGPRIVAIGRRTTADGTNDVYDLDPYNARNEKTVIDVFGAESDLHRAYLELVSGGAAAVTLVALPSDTMFNHTTASVTSASGGGDVFDEAFAAAAAVRADIIVPYGRGSKDTDWNDYATPATPGDNEEIGFHADNTTGASSWLKRIAEKCAEITEESHPCFAILGVKPYLGDTDTSGGMKPGSAASHFAFSDLANRESDIFGDTGIYVSVVVGEIEPLGYNDNYDLGFANGACTYAGHVAQLNSWSALTSKPIVNIRQLRYNPTRVQQEAMVEKGLVPIALNFNRTPTWVDAQTFGKSSSDYTRLSTLRIVFDTVLMIRQVSQRFIGEGSTQANRNALETAITSGLRGMQQVGALLASNFSVTYIGRENKADVDVVIRPAFELRNIDITISVQL